MQRKRLPVFRRTVVETGEKLAQVASSLETCDAVGFDAEMAQTIDRLPGGITKGRQLLALLQIAGGKDSAIVDPLRVQDLSPLSTLMSGPVLKVVLGGATDIQLLQERGLEVRNVVDLAEIAVAVFGHKEEGMRALAERALGLEIDKTIRREDWMRRPIHPAMLNYAHRDAELTLLIYRWFQEEHPNAVASHVRVHFHPGLPPEVAGWIGKFLSKRVDISRLLKEEGIDPESNSERLTREVGVVERLDLSPGQKRRVLRLIGDLKLAPLYDRVVTYTNSSSSILRGAAARALGRLHDERCRPVLERLRSDELEDVRQAAEAALKELDAGPEKVQVEAEEPSPPVGLQGEAAEVLIRLRAALAPDEAAEA